MTTDSIRAYARERRFGEASVERWLNLAAPDAEALLDLVRRLRPGENHFRDLFDDLEDIAVREGCTISSVLARADLRAVIERPAGRNERLKCFKAAVRTLRYPELARAETELRRLAKALSLPPGVRLDLPANLEGEHLTFTVRARSASELRAHAGALMAASARPELEAMLRILRGEP